MKCNGYDRDCPVVVRDDKPSGLCWYCEGTRDLATRCDPPRCARPIGHDGDCRPTWHDQPICGAWMPLAKTHCARKVGHRDTHRSRWALNYDAIAARRKAA